MSDSAYLKTRPAARAKPAAPKPADDYDDAQEASAQYEQYAEYEDDEGYYEDDDEEVAVVSVNRGRAMALLASAVLVIAIFGVAIWMLVGRDAGPAGNAVIGVPTIEGFNPNTSNETQAPAKGALAPDFQWQENGKAVSLSSYRGNKPVFVNFWGTWCPPCKIEMPDMQNLYSTRKQDVEIIGVSMGPRDWPKLVLDFVTASNYNWKFVHDNDGAIQLRYQVVSIPSSYFIDKNGVIQAVHVGAMTRSMMDAYLQQSN